MKKILALALISILILSLSACVDLRDVPQNPDELSQKVESFVENNSQEEKKPNISSDIASQQNGQPSNEVSSSPNSSPSDGKISKDKAIEIALVHAKLSKSEVRQLEAELDRERNGLYWEVDFESGGYDYSYDIDSKDGKIVKSQKEKD